MPLHYGKAPNWLFGRMAILILLFLCSFISELNADTVYLKNGHKMEGLIKEEAQDYIELEIGFGTIKFSTDEVESIARSSQEEITQIREEWKHQKLLEAERRLRREETSSKKTEQKKRYRQREIEISQENGYIVVDALLNKKINASLLLDTGASTVLLTSDIAEKLDAISRKGDEEEIIQVQVADGRKIDAKRIVLDNVKVGSCEAKDVEAVVLLDEYEMNIKDGLLGMSFLNRFNFQIDTVNKILILQNRD